MKRREFFKTASVATIGAAAATTLATPAIAQGNINWRMVTTWPKNFPGLGVGAQRLADRITAASGGRLTMGAKRPGKTSRSRTSKPLSRMARKNSRSRAASRTEW